MLRSVCVHTCLLTYLLAYFSFIFCLCLQQSWFIAATDLENNVNVVAGTDLDRGRLGGLNVPDLMLYS